MRGLRETSGTVAIVTGASSGIGAELARQLAREGMRVALLARRRERLVALAESIAKDGGEALPLACDVADRASVDAAVRAVLERWGGRVDVLVNNAGYARHVLFKDHDDEDVERMVRTNVLGPIHCTKAVLPAMRERRSGLVVMMSSVAGRLGQPDEAVYSATKFAVTGLAEALAYELAPLGIHVMTVYPALVATEMFTPEALARMPESLKRAFMPVPDFARAVVRAMKSGRHELTIPWRVKVAYALRLFFPGIYRRIVARMRLPSLPDLVT